MSNYGILFDLDGTLWDSAEHVATAWNEVFANHPGLSLTLTADDIHAVMGMLLPDIAKKLLPDMPEEERTPLFKEAMDNEIATLERLGGQLYPNLVETLMKLRTKYKLYIVSNCQCGYIESFLNHHKMWQYFDGKLAAGDTGLPKWDNIKKVVEDEHLTRAIYVGDIYADYMAASRAGIRFIHASYGFGSVPKGTLSIPSIDALPEVADAFFCGKEDKVKQKITAKVVSQKKLCDGIFSMEIEAFGIAAFAKAGQFISVYTNDGAHLLPRPISLCEVDPFSGTLRIVYRVAGFGTEAFSKYQAGDPIEILGPLGNGFPTRADSKAFLIGGGIGIPPMLEMAKTLNAQGMVKEDIIAVLGYRDVLFLNEDFANYATVVIATEDGSAGTKGNVLNAIQENGLTADVIYACGPTPMLRAIKAYAVEKGITCYVSMEEKMACGVGACLGCVCQSTEVDEHSQVHNKRICKDGPAFDATEVVI